MLGRRVFAGLLTAAACGATAVDASAAGVVGQTQIDQAIQTINVDAAISPIDIARAIQPLEVTQTRGNTTTLTLSADVLFAFNQATLTSPAQGTIASIARRLALRAPARSASTGTPTASAPPATTSACRAAAPKRCKQRCNRR